MKKIPIKNVIALLLFFVFIYVMISQISHKTTPAAQKGKRSKKRRQKVTMVIPNLAVNLLEHQAMTTRENGRNIFRYGPPPVSKRPVTPPPRHPKPPNVGPGGVGRPGLGAGPGGGAKPAAPVKKNHPPINFKYLGSFGPKGHMLAVISNGEEIQDVFEGEVFMENFIVNSIGLESVTIGFVGFPEDETEILEVGS